MNPSVKARHIMKIDKPLIIVFENEEEVQTHLYPGERSYQQYGILVADLVRHAANAFKVHENHIWNGWIRNAIIKRVLLWKSNSTNSAP